MFTRSVGLTGAMLASQRQHHLAAKVGEQCHRRARHCAIRRGWQHLVPRFEAVGAQLRVYMNDVLVLEASDSSHDTGRYGRMMYRAGVEYDDILARSPDPR